MTRARKDTKTYTTPAPIRGWNAKDNVAQMSPLDALDLMNVIADGQTCRIRKGFRQHSVNASPSDPILSLFEYVGDNGTRTLISASDGNLWDTTTLSGTPSSLKSGLTEDRWQGITFKDLLILVNGTDQPQQYNGSAVSDATYTGFTDNNAINISAYRGRVYLVEKNTMKVWYTAAGAATGACTEYDMSTLFTKGGYLLFAGSWSRDIGDGFNDRFVAVTSEGEVAVFHGSNPGDTEWVSVGHYYLARPLGRRAAVPIGADLIVLTEQGAIPLSSILGGQIEDGYAAITDRVDIAWKQSAEAYRDRVGWEIANYVTASLLIFNIPTSDNATANQYVLHTKSGSWCRFTGINATCWCIFNGKPYFGTTGGKVMQFDYGLTDAGSNISTIVEPAFNNYKDSTNNKRFLMARPLLKATGSLNFSFGVSVDYVRRQFTSSITTDGGDSSTWDLAEWDTAPWGDSNVINRRWYPLSGCGRSGSVTMKGAFRNVAWELNAIDIIYELGGII